MTRKLSGESLFATGTDILSKACTKFGPLGHVVMGDVRTHWLRTRTDAAEIPTTSWRNVPGDSRSGFFPSQYASAAVLRTPHVELLDQRFRTSDYHTRRKRVLPAAAYRIGEDIVMAAPLYGDDERQPKVDRDGETPYAQVALRVGGQAMDSTIGLIDLDNRTFVPAEQPVELVDPSADIAGVRERFPNAYLL